MKIRYSVSLLAILIQSSFLYMLPAEVKAANDIIIQEEEKTELTIKQKKEIFNNVQKELSKHGIKLNQDDVINNNNLYLGLKMRNKSIEEQQEILSTISLLTWLENLNLYNNRLTLLPEIIGNLINLKELNLSCNEIDVLPETIGNLINLQHLHLTLTKLNALPETIEKLINLKELNLAFTKFSTLPETIKKLISLETLDLSYNQLTTIPASIRNINTITVLKLLGNPHLISRSDNPLQLGKEELRTHFRNRVILDFPLITPMPNATTKKEVYKILDKNPLRINRDIFAANKLPDIQVDKVFEGEEMLEALTLIVTSMNFSNDKEEGYLSYEMLANDFASDAQNQNLSNIEKIWQFLMPRLTGYVKTLYNLPLEGKDVPSWKMYKDQIPETQEALTFIMERIKNTTDPDAKMLLFNLLVNGLLHCPTGQAEGINAVAYALSDDGYQTNNFKDNLRRFLAIKKNASFTTAILAKAAENSQNVHLISTYRDQLKEDLGLTSAIASYQERMGAMGQDPFAGNKWNVVQVFYDLINPNRLIDWVMQASQTKNDLKNSELYLRTDVNTSTREQLKAKIEQNKQFHPFTVSNITTYLHNNGLLSNKDDWKKYFTADPVEFFDSKNDASIAVLTRKGAKAILIHEGFLIKEPKSE